MMWTILNKHRLLHWPILASLGFSCSSLQSQTIKVAAPEIPPFVYSNNQLVTGSLVECLNKNKSHRYEVTILPWARALREVELGRLDAIMPTIKTSDRQKFLIYPNKPLVKFKDDIIVTLNSYELSNNIPILGKLRASPITKTLDSQLKSIGVEKYEIINSIDYKTLLNQLQENRIDGVLGETEIIFQNAKWLGIERNLKVIELSEITSNSYLAFSKRNFSAEKVNSIMDSVNCTEINNN